MVVLLDLDEEDLDAYNGFRDGTFTRPGHRHHGVANEALQREGQEMTDAPERENPNLNGFSAALACYPVVSQITHSLDLVDLHALAQTCRQFRVNLLQFQRQLVTQTLRCENEGLDGPQIPRQRPRADENPWARLGERGDRRAIQRLSSGEVGRCARDLVAACRKCDRVVCRVGLSAIFGGSRLIQYTAQNCISKPPVSVKLAGRHRRLCLTCLNVPLSYHTTPGNLLSAARRHTFTLEAFSRKPCTCPDSVWLCQPCGQALASIDTTYRRVWTWRTRYSTYLGGLGTGIGEGTQGVKCGREDECLAAKEIEVEIDCDAKELQEMERELEEGEAGPGYMMQEIEGIGGIVKKKVKKRVKLGAVVTEYEDERESAKYLTREEKGEQRSWCGWCSRVIPGPNESDDDDDDDDRELGVVEESTVSTTELKPNGI
ncbi:MAG: hypothetical protein M1819_004747 [Sarea resinae]|nr:MAG: hypothetical protein M1819_004747 [Sarea resinae]